MSNRTSRFPSLAPAAAALAIGLDPGGARAAYDSVIPYSAGGSSAVTAEHYRCSPQPGEFYTEEFALTTWLEGGAEVGAEVVLTNVGLGDQKAGARAWFRSAQGQEVRANATRKEGEWSCGGSPNRLQVGGIRITGSPGLITLEVAEGGMEMTATFRNTLPPWRPGTGRTYFGSDRKDFYDFTILAPRADVSGRVRIGGAWQEFRGIGYADHKVTTVAPHDQARTWIRFRAFDPDWTIIAQEFILPRSLGGGRVPFLLVGYKDNLVFQSLRHRLDPDKMEQDPKFGYRYPWNFKLHGAEGDRVLDGVIWGTRMTGRTDLLSDLGAIERAVVSRFARPVGYYFDAEYALTLKVGDRTYTMKGTGSYVVKHLNP